MEDQTVKNPDKGGVQSVARIFELIEVLAAHPAGASLQRLAEDAHLAKSTTHRLLGSLVSLGYAAQDSETGKYRLTLKMFEISSGQQHGCDERCQGTPGTPGPAHRRSGAPGHPRCTGYRVHI